jgi:hypothetical protein
VRHLGWHNGGNVSFICCCGELFSSRENKENVHRVLYLWFILTILPAAQTGAGKMLE